MCNCAECIPYLPERWESDLHGTVLLAMDGWTRLEVLTESLGEYGFFTPKVIDDLLVWGMIKHTSVRHTNRNGKLVDRNYYRRIYG